MNSSRCLELNNSFVQISNCDNEKDTQKWEYDDKEHTLKMNGKCLSSILGPDTTEVWSGLLKDETYAVLLLNRGSKESKVEISWKEIGFDNKKAELRDLWEKKDLGTFNDSYYIILKSHDSQLIKVTPIKNKLNKNILIIIIAISVILLGIILGFILYMKNKKENEIEIMETNAGLIKDDNSKTDENKE